jgi:hypothetical protein
MCGTLDKRLAIGMFKLIVFVRAYLSGKAQGKQ